MKSDSKKRSLRFGKFIASVYDVYCPRDHGHYGTDADHVPVISGNDFASEVTSAEGYQLQDSASDNMDMCQAQIGE